ncbi:S24 family peptidase [Agrobacterium vitis]|uniref:LexA family transcriptional regulator n=1 Tax=Agrobacterium vitis TaxID=373 RepID=A0AAE4W9V3_AGRVI|nr:S24 family peptidase [Agrobacterium vitis]MCF1498783.1 S24 family peptidase [Allorhizobium sp. Av2]MUZ56521.1 LexA family transcriptional regulator [Agrobacterium vitis]MVA64342.1 LexA family transcriptional regulator [Agrobacterium vitis]MVA85314.1 LexA family transcriptional regulator [Agrobacterium vitis]
MSDPQLEIKLWLAEKLKSHGVASRLSSATGLTLDKITRSKNVEGDDPKKRRQIKPHELEAIARFFGELPPGYEDMKSWLMPRPSLIPSFDPDAIDAGEVESGYSREYWHPSTKGALPEIDGKLGAGEGAVGTVINIPAGTNTISGHRVIAEWVVPENYLFNEAKASPNHTIVMEVIGDSMSPTYQPGDRVLIDLNQNSMVSDTVYAISDGFVEPQIKRLQRVPFSDPPQVIIISDNPNLQPFTVPLEKLTIIGRICGIIARR